MLLALSLRGGGQEELAARVKACLDAASSAASSGQLSELELIDHVLAAELSDAEPPLATANPPTYAEVLRALEDGAPLLASGSGAPEEQEAGELHLLRVALELERVRADAAERRVEELLAARKRSRSPSRRRRPRDAS